MGHPRADLPPELVGLASRQYGLLAVGQLRSVVTPGAVAALARSGILQRVELGVYRLAGAAPSFRQRAMTACLAYGPPVAVSHLAAARLWGCEVRSGIVEVTVPRGRSGRKTCAVTYRGLLAETDLAVRHGIPVTGTVRTLLDLSLTEPPGALGARIDDLLRLRHLTPASLRDGLAGHPGHRGYQRLLAVAASRLEGLDGRASAPGSQWEQRLLRLLLAAGLPPPVAQHQVVIGDTVYVLDHAYPEWMVAIEFDGFEWHRGRGRFDADRRRASELGLAGWLLITVTSAHTAAETVDRARRALLQRGRDPAAPPKGSAAAG